MTKEDIRLPGAFCERMQKLLGAEAEEFFSSCQKEREYGLRYNPLKFRSQKEFEEILDREPEWKLSPVPWCSQGYYYRGTGRPGRHPWHEAGAYYIQEPSAMSAAELLGAEPGERICDLCAAPGGKTTQIAGKMQGQGLLVANEFHGGRAKILAQNVERMGIANTVVLNESTAHLAQGFPGFFDRILVDAPCSGEGMFRKEPEAASEWTPENVELCAVRQQEILEHAAEMLRPGGVLVYSTCTFSPQENEQCICRFLEAHTEFSLETSDVGEQYFAPGRMEWASYEGGDAGGICREIVKTYRLWPHKLRGEGHFAARLRKAGSLDRKEGIAGSDRLYDKKEGIAGNDRLYGKKEGRKRGGGKRASELEAAVARFHEFQGKSLRINLEKKHSGRYVLFSEQLYFLPENMPELSGWRVVRPGLHLGTCKKNRFEPSHALALYLHREEAGQSVECADPLRYLHGETIPCESTSKGWTLVCVDGLPLGWGKAVNGTLKNHYPKGLRICY